MSLGEALDRAREGRGDQERRCRTRCTGSSSITSATSGSVHVHRHRMGSEDVSGTVCPSAIRRHQREEVAHVRHCGTDSSRQDRRHRPGDDGDAAVAEASRPGLRPAMPSTARRRANELVMRFKLAEQEDMTKGFDIHDEVKQRQARGRRAARGARAPRSSSRRGRDRIRLSLPHRYRGRHAASSPTTSRMWRVPRSCRSATRWS